MQTIVSVMLPHCFTFISYYFFVHLQLIFTSFDTFLASQSTVSQTVYLQGKRNTGAVRTCIYVTNSAGR